MYQCTELYRTMNETVVDDKQPQASALQGGVPKGTKWPQNCSKFAL